MKLARDVAQDVPVVEVEGDGEASHVASKGFVRDCTGCGSQLFQGGGVGGLWWHRGHWSPNLTQLLG